ncbi:hypothetical protein HYDPIDRAFT_174196 [Hydnomerulius pinastri MD-312]|nr:hypothetical protein HYDPIDRAFT_174196 [Hydnomerulius pinastri MD-312]
MDGEDASYHQDNAVAGPSTIFQSAPVVFLPPASAYSQPQTFLASTQDLLSRFQLRAAYDTHVRIPLAQSSASAPSPVAPNNVPHDPPPDGDDKKKKNSYRHLIKSVPGKHSLKKDDYLTMMMQVPPKQRIPIVEFDARTQREAFSVSAEGLKNWNAGALILESAQARENRKKRKELKKLARAQGLTPGPLPGTPGAFPQSQPAPPNSTIPFTQQPPAASQTPVSQSKPRLPAVTIPPPGSANRSGTTPTPTSATPRSAVPSSAAPPRTTTPMPGALRGKKRELEDGVVQPPTPTANPAGVNTTTGVVGARAGVGNARPRPVKKQRMDMQGQSREMPMQQPTPQGS